MHDSEFHIKPGEKIIIGHWTEFECGLQAIYIVPMLSFQARWLNMLKIFM